MKSFLLTTALFFSLQSFGQLISGDLLDEGRKLITETSFTMVGSTAGEIYYELAVNREGKVTSEKLLTDKTTINSTPLRYGAKNYVRTLKFEPGTYYPEFHHVVVRIVVEKM